MNTENITDLPATSPLFLEHLTDTFGGSIQIQSKANKTFTIQNGFQTGGS